MIIILIETVSTITKLNIVDKDELLVVVVVDLSRHSIVAVTPFSRTKSIALNLAPAFCSGNSSVTHNVMLLFSFFSQLR